MRSVWRQRRSSRLRRVLATHCGPNRELPALASPLSSFPSQAPSQSASTPPRSLLSGGLRMSSPAALLSPNSRRWFGRVALVSYHRPRVAAFATALRGGSAGSAVTGRQALLSFLLRAWLPNPAVNTDAAPIGVPSLGAFSTRPASAAVLYAQRRLPSRWASLLTPSREESK